MNRDIILGIIITNIYCLFAKVSSLQAISHLIFTTTLRLSCYCHLILHTKKLRFGKGSKSFA